MAKVLAAILGGYGLAYTSGAALAKILPLRPSEAVYLIGMLQVLLYVGVVIWIFSVSARRAWIVLALLIALCELVVLIN
ncbi:MAG: iron transporter [Steroidobacteraceae bacterium]